ncbi:MAG: hypothetical protein KUG74_10335 [Rhodobacteraceae bacterium]|nr:hypothetical protein [Paracoccaceae bacterium]
MDVVALSESTQAKLKEALPFAGIGNPFGARAQIVSQMGLLETNIDVLFGGGDNGAWAMANSLIAFCIAKVGKGNDTLKRAAASFRASCCQIKWVPRTEANIFLQEMLQVGRNP